MTKPIPRETIWGGKSLRKYFDYPEDFGDSVGQCWAFSAQKGASTILSGGEYDGKTLLELWEEHPELFQSRYREFPYIISLVVPEDDLSIQVHPDDTYAKQLGLSHGKNEAWYFIRAPRSGNIVYGHNASDEPELRSMIAAGQWNALVRYMPVQTGDTVYIPAGTLHALRKGSVVYEIQQSTDITYRFYDYDRRDAQGRLRPLQLEQAISCLHYDQELSAAHPLPQEMECAGGHVTTCVENDSFVVRKLVCHDGFKYCFPGYALITVSDGEGTINGIPAHLGQNFLVTVGTSISVSGNLVLLSTSEI